MKRTRVIEMRRTAMECIDSLFCTACVLCLNPLRRVGGGVRRDGIEVCWRGRADQFWAHLRSEEIINDNLG